MSKNFICFAVLCPKSTKSTWGVCPSHDSDVFRKENDRKSGNSPTYSNKLRESNMISLVNQNRDRVEPFATIIDNAFERYTSELQTNMDPFGQQDNDETYEEQCQ